MDLLREFPSADARRIRGKKLASFSYDVVYGVGGSEFETSLSLVVGTCRAANDETSCCWIVTFSHWSIEEESIDVYSVLSQQSVSIHGTTWEWVTMFFVGIKPTLLPT